jgi:hypothetical protein
MSSEERKKILQMVAEGKINADEAATLMRALDEATEEESPVEVFQSEPSGWSSEKSDAPEFDEIRTRVQRFAAIPLWVGVFVTTLSAWWMFGAFQNSGYGFWFFCLAFPLMLGILLIAVSAGGKNSRWLYVNVDRSKQNDWPRNITLGFPLPLDFAAWVIRTFKVEIDGMKLKNVDGISQAILMAKTMEDPLIVNVDDSDGDGERVQVFIG